MLLTLFAPANIFFSYLVSFGFNKPESGLKWLSVLYLVTGLVIPFVSVLLEVETTIHVQYLMSAIPLSVLIQGLLNTVFTGNQDFISSQMKIEGSPLERKRNRYVVKMESQLITYNQAKISLIIMAVVSLLAIVIIEKRNMRSH